MNNEKINVLFLGETWTVTKIHTKGFDVVKLGGFDDYSVYLKRGLQEADDIEIDHIPNHEILTEFPEKQSQLDEYDVVIVSDTGRNTLTMYGDMFTMPMGPDRLEMIRRFVEEGGGFIMAGGYVCFQGFQGKGNYHGSEIEKLLPVNISEIDDRVERTDGVRPTVTTPDHDILQGVADDWPRFLGYQSLEAKEGSTVLAEAGDGDPFITVWEYGDGRSMAFASDLAPHWGIDFVDWESYPRFWAQTLRWLSKRTG
ncbi:cytoplasmic protein [Candidatus Bipolaricaulota bacterium]|nr:cytoplasmic protein [Candidatus Bipolaricaulota bacterium]